MQAPRELIPFGYTINNMITQTINNMITQTIGYVTTDIIAHSTATALGGWSPFMGATILGSLALYFPLKWTRETLLARHLLTPLVSSLVSAAVQIAAPLIGAALLNFGFAGTIPLLPCLICSVIGVATTRFLYALFVKNDQPANAEPSPLPAATRRPLSYAQQRVYQYREARLAAIRNLGVFPAHANINSPSQNNPIPSSVVIEELDNDGNVIRIVPRSVV